jgi:hypothetical protein
MLPKTFVNEEHASVCYESGLLLLLQFDHAHPASVCYESVLLSVRPCPSCFVLLGHVYHYLSSRLFGKLIGYGGHPSALAVDRELENHVAVLAAQVKTDAASNAVSYSMGAKVKS